MIPKMISKWFARHSNIICKWLVTWIVFDRTSFCTWSAHDLHMSRTLLSKDCTCFAQDKHMISTYFARDSNMFCIWFTMICASFTYHSYIIWTWFAHYLLIICIYDWYIIGIWLAHNWHNIWTWLHKIGSWFAHVLHIIPTTEHIKIVT